MRAGRSGSISPGMRSSRPGCCATGLRCGPRRRAARPGGARRRSSRRRRRCARRPRAAAKLRAKDFAGAEALLQPLCPDARRQTPEGRASADCSLRNAGLAEARNVNQGRDLATLYWRAGDLLAKDGRPDAALEAFQKGLDILPGHADIWFSVGMARRGQGGIAAARMAFDKSLALRPGDARTMDWVATTLMDQGKLVEADALLDQVEEADPKEFHVWVRRGEILMMRGH